MTIRAVMATPDDNSMQEEGEQVNGDKSEEHSEVTTPTGLNTIRSRGSKVSNLRAAFEQAANNDAALKSVNVERRLTSNGRPGDLETELSRLKETLAKEQEQRDEAYQRMESMQEELDDLRERLSNRLDTRDEEDMDTSEQPDGERLAIELHLARAHAQSSEDELGVLRNQLAEMKRSIATNTRIENHEMTDSAFQGEFGTLCYLIQDWVINSYRKSKVEKSVEEMCSSVDALAEQSAAKLKPLFQQWDGSSKLSFIQAVIVCMMLPIFEDPMPFGLPSTLSWSEAVRLASEELADVLDVTAYNRWRATTFDIICHSEAVSPFVHSAANKITTLICNTLETLCGVTTAETHADALRNVVRRVIALSHSLRVQRASYEVVLPEVGSAFEAKEMEDVTDEHDGDRTVQYAVFPGVFKAGPGDRALIFKARVSCIER